MLWYWKTSYSSMILWWVMNHNFLGFSVSICSSKIWSKLIAGVFERIQILNFHWHPTAVGQSFYTLSPEPPYMSPEPLRQKGNPAPDVYWGWHKRERLCVQWVQVDICSEVSEVSFDCDSGSLRTLKMTRSFFDPDPLSPKV